eukprot:SAG11_NODE_926_length_6520_cov_6.586357_1_plen_312_part_00
MVVHDPLAVLRMGGRGLLSLTGSNFRAESEKLQASMPSGLLPSRNASNSVLILSVLAARSGCSILAQRRMSPRSSHSNASEISGGGGGGAGGGGGLLQRAAVELHTQPQAVQFACVLSTGQGGDGGGGPAHEAHFAAVHVWHWPWLLEAPDGAVAVGRGRVSIAVSEAGHYRHLLAGQLVWLLLLLLALARRRQHQQRKHLDVYSISGPTGIADDTKNGPVTFFIPAYHWYNAFVRQYSLITGMMHIRILNLVPVPRVLGEHHGNKSTCTGKYYGNFEHTTAFILILCCIIGYVPYRSTYAANKFSMSTCF